ncbi:MAG: AAA family ATPase [Fibrobacter sp.]|nr:AAA family ATPase [Fibrobacter sp.]
MFWRKTIQKKIQTDVQNQSETVSGLVAIDTVHYDQLLFTDESRKYVCKEAGSGSTTQIIGQQRAVRAIETGLRLKGDGFNIFVSGSPGTGKRSIVKKLVTGFASTQPAPPDICYAINLKNEDNTEIIFLPAGTGPEFKKDCDHLIKVFNKMGRELFMESSFDVISEKIIYQLVESCAEVPQNVSINTIRNLEYILDEIKTVQQKYQKNEQVSSFLENVKTDFLRQAGLINRYCNSFTDRIKQLENVTSRYSINLQVNNCTSGAPVVFEDRPSVKNLCGYFKYKITNGSIYTDHTMIVAGSILRANGGYLVLEIEEIVGDSEAWDCLKKCIKHKMVSPDNGCDVVFPLALQSVKTAAIPVNFKVILTGDPVFFDTLEAIDDEFRELFKVKAEISDVLVRTTEVETGFKQLVDGICSGHNLRPCTEDAVKTLLNYSSRTANHREKISAKFSNLVDILAEADNIASKENETEITPVHIRETSYERCFRSRAAEEALLELIKENVVRIDTCGMAVGQVNGVSVIDMGDYTFGRPVRITARTFVGAGNIINIEREADMSGNIHSKGVLILSGYLGQIYAQDKPLALNASICFEQCYEEIDGDSASSAELYCILSNLSGVPLRQEIAVTGSIDQDGRIQAVGGINQKIEGFYNACMVKGLTGTQGILIPESNLRNLVLNDEIIEAVRNKSFHIYPVQTIEEGLSVLTGKDPGTSLGDGSFNRGTIHFLVNQKLRSYASVSACFEKTEEQFF